MSSIEDFLQPLPYIDEGGDMIGSYAIQYVPPPDRSGLVSALISGADLLIDCPAIAFGFGSNNLKHKLIEAAKEISS